MKKIICDRCGETCAPPYGKNSIVPILLKMSTGGLSLHDVDLCETCKKEIAMRNKYFMERREEADE